MTKRKGSRRAFSLIEVVVALGIFAVAVVGVLGLLGSTSETVSNSLDSGTAVRLAGLVNAEIERAGFIALTGGNQLLDSGAVAGLATDHASLLFSNRTGDRLCGPTTSATEANYVALAERYFELMLIRNNELSPDNAGGFVAFVVAVTWPAYVSDGAGGAVVVARAQRAQLNFNAAVTR